MAEKEEKCFSSFDEEWYFKNSGAHWMESHKKKGVWKVLKMFMYSQDELECLRLAAVTMAIMHSNINTPELYALHVYVIYTARGQPRRLSTIDWTFV